MKKFLASLSIFCAISSHAQPSGFVFIGENAAIGTSFIGNVKPQFLIANPSAKLAEYTIFYARTSSFTNFVADCMRPDVSFLVTLDMNGNKYRGNPFMTPQGTLGWDYNVYACSNAYVWPSNSDSKPEPKRQRTIPI